MKKIKVVIVSLMLITSIISAWGENVDRRELLMKTIRCMETSCHDEPIIQTLIQASEEFAIPELNVYAHLCRQNVMDTCLRRTIGCIERLIAYSDNLYDSISYESVYLRFLSMENTLNVEKWEQQLAEVYPLAIALYDKDQNPQNKELWYYACLLHLIGNGISCDPTKEYDIAKLIVEIDNFYKNHPRSSMKQRIYAVAGENMQAFSMKFDAYARCLGEILSQEGRNESIFNMAIDTLYLYDSIPIYLYTSYCTKESFHCYQELHKDCSIDIISSEISYLAYAQLCVDNAEVLIPYLENGYTQLVSYLGENDPSYIYANVFIRQIATKLKQEVHIPKPNREIMAAYALPEGIALYIRFLYAMVGLESTNTLALRSLCQEMRQLAETHLSKYPARRIGACMGEIYLQRQKAIGYENAFTKLMFDFEIQCRNQASWELVDVGKDLAQLAVVTFFRIDDALRIEYDVLRMVQQLTSDTCLIFKAEYGTYLQYAINAYPIQPQDIDGQYGMEHLIQSVENTAANTMLQVPLKWLVASYYINAGEMDKASVLCQQLVEEIAQIRKQTKNPYYLRDTELEAYAQWLMCSKGMSEKEWKKHIQKLEKLYFAAPEVIRFAPANILTMYYSTHKQWEKAMRVVDFALEQLDTSGHNLWDGLYVQLARIKVELLINSKTDIDQCRLMAEQLNQDVQQIKEIGNYSIYLNLLQIVCQLTNISSPNDIIHYKNLRLMYEKAKEYYDASDHSDQVNFNFMLPAYTSMCRTAFNNWNTNHPTEYYLLQYDIEHEVLPKLLEMERRFQEVFTDHYTESPNYAHILADIAMAYDIAYQPDSAKIYFDKLAPLAQKEIDLFYMVHYAMTRDESNFMEHMQSFFHSGVDSDLYGSYGKGFMTLGKWNEAITRNDWKNAEQYAWEYYAVIQAYMQQNLLFFTQAETEHFLMQNGVGGMPVQAMVAIPDLKQKKKLIEQAYTINLQQKGLMLRKADRLRQAVDASMDSALITLLDSVQLLRHEVMEVNESQLMVGVDNEVIEKREQLFAMERKLARNTQHLLTKEKETTWKDVRDNLRADEAAVEYVVFPQFMYALVITPKCQTPQYVPLNLAMESLQSAYTILSDTSLTDLQKTERMYGDESMLYDALWQPLETYFNGAKSIYFSPTGPLNLICFHALRVNVSTYLTDRYDLHQLTNTALLAERNKLSSNMSLGRRAKVYGAIYYNKAQELSHAKLTHLREEYTFLSEPLYADNRAVLGDVFPFLQNTLYEADGIHHTLTAMGVNSSEEIGFTPTESAIRSLNGHSPEILHISTHGFFYNSLEEVRDIPYFKKGGELNAMTCSGLALANADDAWLGLSEADSKDDNILTSAEVSELDLRNTQLVVLSACQTGLGSVGADGVFGLQRGFKQAGVESICASLWSVADKSTAEMMQLFYKYWMSEKMTIHTAMKRAMKEQRHTTPSPYYWAPFVLIDAIE